MLSRVSEVVLDRQLPLPEKPLVGSVDQFCFSSLNFGFKDNRGQKNKKAGCLEKEISRFFLSEIPHRENYNLREILSI